MVQEVFTGLVGFSGPLVFRPDRLNDLNDFVLTALGLMTALTTIYLALRAPEPRPELTDADEASMRSCSRAARTPSATSTCVATRAWSGPSRAKRRSPTASYQG
jgi:hypothetical protein